MVANLNPSLNLKAYLSEAVAFEVHNILIIDSRIHCKVTYTVVTLFVLEGKGLCDDDLGLGFEVA